jgi:hypothetical protein
MIQQFDATGSGNFPIDLLPRTRWWFVYTTSSLAVSRTVTIRRVVAEGEGEAIDYPAWKQRGWEISKVEVMAE